MVEQRQIVEDQQMVEAHKMGEEKQTVELQKNQITSNIFDFIKAHYEGTGGAAYGGRLADGGAAEKWYRNSR